MTHSDVACSTLDIPRRQKEYHYCLELFIIVWEICSVVIPRDYLDRIGHFFILFS